MRKHRGRVRGLSPRIETPHPSRTASAPPFPQGEREKLQPVSVAFTMPLALPKSICVRGLTIRPAANTPSSRGTRTSPVVGVDAHLDELGAERVAANRSASGSPASSAGARPRRRDRRRARRRPAARGRLDDRRAPRRRAHRAAGDATPSAGRCRRSRPGRGRAGTSRASAAIWVSTVRAPVPMSAAPMRDHERPVRVAAADAPSSRPRQAGYVEAATPVPDQPAAVAADAGRGSRSAQPKRSAPSRRHSTRWRLRERRARSPGRARARCGSRSSIGSRPQATASSSIARLEREHARALARRAHPRRARHVERAPGGGVVRRFGAAYIIRVATAVCSANSLMRRGLLDDVVDDRAQPAVGVGAEPDALDGRRAVAGEREHLLPGQRRA